MVIGRPDETGNTEFDPHTVTPPDENFSYCSALLTKGFPMRTAGIWRLPHQSERGLE
jgi:hypothetical protein